MSLPLCSQARDTATTEATVTSSLGTSFLITIETLSVGGGLRASRFLVEGEEMILAGLLSI